MGGDWGPLNARARGLASSLLRRPALHERAGETGSPGELAGGLSRVGYPPDGGELPATPEGLDRAIARVHGWRLALLHRWADGLRERLAVVFEEEDRRILRAMVRGTREGAGPERRLRGFVPTPTLPRGVLEAMAEAESVARLAELLEDAGHPLAGALTDAAGSGPAPADLYDVELALDRAFARRAADAASGDRELREFTARIVDRANAWTLLLAGAAEGDPGPDELHLPGGEAFPRERFGTIYTTGNDGERRRLVAGALGERGVDLAADPAVGAGQLEDRLLEADIRWTRGRARTAPLGPWPFLHLVLISRAEARDLRKLVWSAAMGAPTVSFSPVTPP